MELAKAYNPQEAQEKWLKFWNERGYFHSTPDARTPFTIVIPPPNVTGALHMGHALNNTLQDVLIRWRRMQGYNALWMPGTDHAGIATQAVVERLIFAQEKKTRHDIGREELVKRIWQWKDKYEARILGQLRQLGASCDWERTRFTLDPMCARAVRETFFKMFKDGLIFRGKRLVNWDAHLQTSVADDETYTEDTKGGFWTFKYPLSSSPLPPGEGPGVRALDSAPLKKQDSSKGPGATPSPLAPLPGGEGREYIRFSTTRPETMLGDTAVCVHPADERYKHLIGKYVTIPLVNRDIPIIADGLLADMTLGTGCVKVTPAHDPNDYACYQRNPQIGIINILNPDGTINEAGGKYQGMDRLKAREAVVADMEALGFFEGREDRMIPLKFSDRSKTPIEPYLSDQWFVKMGDFSPLPPGEGPGVRGEPESNKRKPHHAPMPADLLEFVRKLRGEQTDAEKLLWALLRDRRLAGYKFRRQHPEDPYVLDFYCQEARLAVELDGAQHNSPEGKLRDEQRSAFLSSKGIRVIRFWNHDVLQDTETVLEAIWRDLDSGSPLPPGEGLGVRALGEIPSERPSLTPSPPAPLPGGEGRNAGLAQMAMDAVTDGRVKFFPERYAKSYLDWLGEKRDWCISRQLWWGHRIPVWHFIPGAARVSTTNMPSLEQAWAAVGELIRATGIQEEVLVERAAYNYFYLCAGTERAEAVLRELEALTQAHCGAEPGAESVQRFGDLAASYQRAATGVVVDQDPDVLDTWFSSMLWPHSTLGWPEKTPELAYYYPTSVLVTSRDIITLWVARMVIAGLYNLDQVPFKDVYITVKLLDGFGETMSKSKGNGVDPLDIIDRYGADALRFLIMQISTETQDARLPVANVCPHCDTLVPVKQEHMYMRTKKLACPHCKQPFRPGGPWPSDDPELKTAKQASERFEVGRNFANKIWNAARFILMNLDGYTPGALKREGLPLEDRWILSRLAWATQSVTDQLEGFHFSEVARTLYDFVWSEFCDWYLEMSKGRLKDFLPSSGTPGEGLGVRAVQPAMEGSALTPGPSPGVPGEGRKTVQRVLIGVLDAIVRLAHPVMPFLAESLWAALNDAAPKRGLPNPEPATESVMIAPWPTFPADWRDVAMEASMARMQELVRSVREVRNRYSIEPRTPLDAFVRCNDAVAGDFRTLAPFIIQLAGIGKLESGPDVAKPVQAASHVTPEFEVYVSLKGLIDPAAEVKRLEKQLAEKRKQLQAAQAKLENANFVKNAPPEIVQQQREQVADLQKQIETIEANIRDLQQ